MDKRARLLALAVFAAALAFAAEPLLTGRGTDFRAYLEASAALRAGHDPYAGVHPYLYPPLLAVALVPLTFLPPFAAAWIWAAASAAALAASAVRVAKGSARVLVLALLFAPFAATQWNLQANAFVLLFLVLARERLDSGFEAGGGALLGLSIALKPFGLLAAALLVLVGRWRAALAALGAALLPFAFVVPFSGVAGAASSARTVGRILSSSWVETYGGNVSLNGSLDRLLPAGAGAPRH
ncbi:MAG: glycosyltransferase 87 family protein, partial [Thermoanaerobaculia bacterium]